MPCSITTSTAIKIVTLSSQGVKGCINVFAPDGELLGLINAKEVTAFRTSLAVMIPFLRFPQEKANIVVFGAGKQAEWHIRLALLLCKDVKRITIVNRTNPAKMEQLFETLRQKYPDVSFDVLVTSVPEYDSRLQELLSVSDCIFGCTPATTPHFPNSYLSVSKPRFISLIGSYKPSMQEVDGETLLSGGKIFVDSKEDCLIEAGELINAGVREDQLVEIGDIENYERVARTQTNHVFKCVGLAIMDILAARELLSLAKSKGLGLDIGDL
ncbi:putative proline utilization protein [Phaeoacremonium minimum UCRPA7]|uniref:Putative proline utilization protein n=1 Tax=Phaeoacremonium minimum (strain UCR-PA7) TaxID=1286976 RepID=R8BP81_PHAM7|nr:putative proline utilization protein [Phaeoacremonium minimum UCRPA7]EOO01139.1 putative proline utilization protein [Phaeoacremonium minimum UCRPA7]